MSVEVKIPSDVATYKSKLIFGLSVRQFVSLIFAMGIAVIIGLIGRKFLSEDTVVWLIICVSVPFICYGFITFKDMKFEEFFKHWFNFNFMPQKRYLENAETDELSNIQTELIEKMLESEGD